MTIQTPKIPRKVSTAVDQAVSRGDYESLSWRIRSRWRNLKSSSSKPATNYSQIHMPEGDENAISTVFGFRSSSQVAQDLFVRIMTRDSSLNTYLEIGGCYPILLSNTFVLEHDLGWHGVSLELDETLARSHVGIRTSPCLPLDATLADYSQILGEQALGPDFGYLSLDIDPSYQSLKALERIPFEENRFAVITFEHDAYRTGSKVRNASRRLLRYYGYELVVGDVTNDGLAFEDWYVHPELVSSKIWSPLRSNKIDPHVLLNSRRSIWRI